MSDTPPLPQPTRQFRPVAELVHALRFLTRLPLPLARTMDMPPLAQSMRMFSLAGVLIGLIIAAVLLLARFLGLPPLLAATFALVAGLLLTGALHEDGLADTADGLGGGHTRERRLEIMRDSRIGSYGTLALVSACLARVACYAALLALPAAAILAAVAAAQGFSRAVMVDALWATAPARSDGLAIYAGRPTRAVTVGGILIGLVATLASTTVLKVESAPLAMAAALLVTEIVRRLALRRIGGITGDVCGAVQVGSEIAMLSVIVAINH